DVGDTHLRGEVVAGDRNRHAAPVEPARRMTEEGRIERAPIAAVNKERERRGAAIRREEQIDRLPRRRAVADAQFRASRAGGLVAIGRRTALPGGKDLRMLRYPGADVVFDLVIDRHEALLRRSRLRFSAPGPLNIA